MSLVILGTRGGRVAQSPSDFAHLAPLYTLPTGLTYNPLTGRVEGDVYAPTPPIQSGVVHSVANESQFITALANAQRGDTIRLTADVTLTASRTLPNPAGAGWVVIEGDTSFLTPYGMWQVTSGEVASMRKLIVAHSGAGLIAPSTVLSRLWIRGINFTTDTASRSITQFINIRDTNNPTNNDLFPDEVVIDRCGFTGPMLGDVTQRAITLNTRRSRVVGCRFTDIIGVGVENKCVAVWEGSGPYQIDWNYMEGLGMSMLFGGSGMAANVSALVPSDILIRHNHMLKPSRWNQWHPQYDATTYSRITAFAKPCLEFKIGRRALVEGNVFEGTYQSAQTGAAVLIKQAPQGSGQTAQVTEDVTVRLNRVIDCNYVYGLVGAEGGAGVTGCKRIDFSSNFATGTNAPSQSNTAMVHCALDAGSSNLEPEVVLEDWRFRYNTIDGPRIGNQAIRISDGPGPIRQVTRLSIADNVLRTAQGTVATSQFGFFGGGQWGGHGLPSLNGFSDDYTFQRNLGFGSVVSLSSYPSPTYNEALVTGVGFSDYAGGDLRILSGFYSTAAQHGGAIGAPIDLIVSATANVRQT